MGEYQPLFVWLKINQASAHISGAGWEISAVKGAFQLLNVGSIIRPNICSDPLRDDAFQMDFVSGISIDWKIQADDTIAGASLHQCPPHIFPPHRCGGAGGKDELAVL